DPERDRRGLPRSDPAYRLEVDDFRHARRTDRRDRGIGAASAAPRQQERQREDEQGTLRHERHASNSGSRLSAAAEAPPTSASAADPAATPSPVASPRRWARLAAAATTVPASITEAVSQGQSAGRGTRTKLPAIAPGRPSTCTGIEKLPRCPDGLRRCSCQA